MTDPHVEQGIAQDHGDVGDRRSELRALLLSAAAAARRAREATLGLAFPRRRFVSAGPSRRQRRAAVAL